MVHAAPSGTESARPFLPALDFARSKAFYEALGFVIELDDDDVAIYRVGSTSFLLQRYYQKEWAENFMMQLLVDDLDAWWAHIASLDLPEKYGVPEPKPPAMQPWGLRISYLVIQPGCSGMWLSAGRRSRTISSVLRDLPTRGSRPVRSASYRRVTVTRTPIVRCSRLGRRRYGSRLS